MADVAVVGAGIVGLSTAYALTELGASVVLYSRGLPGGGQSGGSERLFRHAHDDPRLAAFARASLAVWREWEAALGVELVSRDGAIAVGPAVSRRLRVLADAGVAARRIGWEEVRSRMPLLADTGSAPAPDALLDADAGSIRAAAAVTTLAGELGPNVLVDDEVLAVRALAGGAAEVRSGGGRADVGRVVVCAGIETPRLARPCGVTVPLALSMHGRGTFAVRGAPPTRVAGWQDASGVFGATGVYGAPSRGNRRFALGVGATGASGDAAGLAAMVASASAYVGRAMPGLDPTPVGVRHCWVTQLPWGDDALAVWETGPLLFVAGNNLFKHAPWLGRAIARAAVGEALVGELRPEARLGVGAEG